MFKSLFPTLVLEEQLEGEVFSRVSSEIDRTLENLKFILDPEDDTGGLYMSDEGIKRTNNLIDRYNLRNLNSEIMRCANKYLDETNTVPKAEFKIFMSIMTSLSPGADSTKHMHQPGCLVAVYYHKTTTDCGNIRIYNPSKYVEFQKDKFIDIVPTEGKILVFPGWLYHEVLKNNSNITRYSIAITMQVYEDLLKE
jgi:uncharacterized protein (TIGR02466 family)